MTPEQTTFKNQAVFQDPMAEKKIGITVKKDENFSEWYTQVVGEQGAQLCDLRYGVQGFVVYRTWGYQLLRKLYDLLDKALEADGHEPFLFPVVIPEENLKKEEEHAGFTPEVFWVTEAGSEKIEKRLALRPTGETAIYPMYSLWIRSYNDLPFKRYQSRISCYRNDMSTRPFFRGREFCFFESHDVFRTHKEAMAQVHTDMKIMDDVIWDKLSVPFTFFKRPKWDKFLGADDTYAADTMIPDGKRLQISSTHDLGHKFAKPFDVSFIDEDGKKKYGYQTCFGPGIIRIIAAIISVHGDDNGLILPSAIAPLDIVIVPITFAGKEDVNKKTDTYCKELKKDLGKKYKVVYDDKDETPGFKYNKWELKGVPIRIEVGPKEVEKQTATIVRRVDRKKISINKAELEKNIKSQLKENDTLIKKRAETYVKDNTQSAESFDEVKKIFKSHRGFVRVPWCSTVTGETCADTLKAETQGVYVCGESLKNPEKVKKGQKCIVCNKTAKHIVYVAKSY